jgi:hypothetical protein
MFSKPRRWSGFLYMKFFPFKENSFQQKERGAFNNHSRKINAEFYFQILLNL